MDTNDGYTKNLFTYLIENISKIKSLEQNPAKNGIQQRAKLETIKHEEVKVI
jgi:hypothetical protein